MKTTYTTPTELEIVGTRWFDASRERVFSVFTDPELTPKWWGPSRYETIVDKMDVTVGGGWRFIHRDTDGNEFAFHGEYLEIDPPAKVVNTLEFEGMPGHVITETMTLIEEDGRTLMTITSLFQSKEDRDGMLASGMAEGSSESYDRLDTLLAA